MIKNGIIYNDSTDWKFNLTKAQDSYIWNSKGKKLIDFTSGWNVTNLGWNNKEISGAVAAQVKKNTYAPMWTTDVVQQKLAESLISSLPSGLDVVARATGGTEANEEALKTARAFTGRKKIIGFKDTYHGQSFGTMSIGYLPEYVASISPMVGGFIQIDYPKTFGEKRSEKEILDNFSAKLEKLLSRRDIAAIVTEAGIITGWGSTYLAPKGYLKRVRALTKKYGTIMILDEVGTGFSRCGELYGMDIEKVVPDIVTFAKGFSNGVAAIGAMVTSKVIGENTFEKTNLTSTFGWTPISCAAALKVIQIHKRDKMWEKSKSDGDYISKVLKNELEGNPTVEDIRGLGMEIGLQLATKKDKSSRAGIIVGKACEKGLHLISDTNNIQIMPPLTIEKSILDKGLEILVALIKKEF